MNPNSVGIVLCGGQSTRMGIDKGKIEYHAMPQYLHAARLLQKFCAEVVISGNKSHYQNPDFPVIPDLQNLLCSGPAAGFYSMAQQYPQKDFLVLACDYPLIQASHLSALIQAQARIAAYRNAQGITEALVAYYRADAVEEICRRIHQGECSLRHIIDSMQPTYLADESLQVKSFDTPQQAQSLQTPEDGVASVAISRYKNRQLTSTEDHLVVEEPLEIRLVKKIGNQVQNYSVAVTMRTPGADLVLAIGFLLTEGVLRQADDILLRECVAYDNRVYIKLHPHTPVHPEQFQRHFYTTSSCGICGKASIEAITVQPAQMQIPSKSHSYHPDQILQISETVRQAQQVFEQTGGLHASALLNEQLQVIEMFEDVGRHNALDKLIGHMSLQASLQDMTLPQIMQGKILFLSGRGSFELLQKCAVAGIQTVCCVGAPSSLAVETARSYNITLIGFLRQNSYNIYHQNPYFQWNNE